MANIMGTPDPIIGLQSLLLQLEDVRRMRALEELTKRTQTGQAVNNSIASLLTLPTQGRNQVAEAMAKTLQVDPGVLLNAISGAPNAKGITEARGVEHNYENALDTESVVGTPADYFRANPNMAPLASAYQAMLGITGQGPGAVARSNAVAGMDPGEFRDIERIQGGTQRSVAQQDNLTMWGAEFGFKQKTAEEQARQFGQTLNLNMQELASRNAYQEGIIAIQRANADADRLRAMAAARAAGDTAALQRLEAGTKVAESMINKPLTTEAQHIYAAMLFNILPPTIIKQAFGLDPNSELSDKDLNRFLGIDAAGWLQRMWGNKSTLPPMQGATTRRP